MLCLWVADDLPGYMVLPTMTTIWVVFLSIAVFCVWDVEDLPVNRHRAQCLDYLSIVHRDMRLGSRPDCLYDTPMSGSLFMWYFALSLSADMPLGYHNHASAVCRICSVLELLKTSLLISKIPCPVSGLSCYRTHCAVSEMLKGPTC
jgi:hypothetical protein